MKQIIKLLQEAGLDQLSAEIYLTLMNTPEMNVSKIITSVKFSRTAVHQSLNFLVKNNLVTFRHQGRETFYQANHPKQLQILIQNKKNDLQVLQTTFNDNLQKLSSIFNLNQNKPAIFIYEGEEAIEKSFIKNTSAKQEIYTYLNRQSFNNYYPELMEKHIKNLTRTGIKEKLILVNCEGARELQKLLNKNSRTQVRLLPKIKEPFEAGMDMFDGKISYASYNKNQSIIVEISDPEMCRLHRQIFEILWQLLPE